MIVTVLIIGVLLLGLPVGVGVIVNNWSRPDVNVGAPHHHKSVTEMVLRDEGDLYDCDGGVECTCPSCRFWHGSEGMFG
jgi:hypothetical protein